MKIYITFGQIHVHRYNNITLDRDCVAMMESPDEESVRRFLFDRFDNKYSTTYPHVPEMKYYPRGIVDIGEVLPEYLPEDPES